MSKHTTYHQLERFLCRECGKVKCSCTALITVHQPPHMNNIAKVAELNKNLNDEEYVVKYRNSNEYPQLSNTEPKLRQYNDNASSDQPFERPALCENGKMRRSFAVRSKEGLENLLNLATIKRGSDQVKVKQLLK